MTRNLSAREIWVLERVKGDIVIDIGFAGQKPRLPAYFSTLKEQKPGIRLVGLDNNRNAVLQRKQSDSVVGDATHLPLVDGTVDCVILAEFIEHHLAIDPFLAEIRRVLRPGGHLLITTPNPLFVNRVIRRWLLPPGGRVRHQANVAAAMGSADHRNLWDPLSLIGILQRERYVVEELCTVGFWIPLLGRLFPRFRRGMGLRGWPFNRVGYITCLDCVKSPD
jgi:SAM-dependent methyltransferase